MSDKEILNQLLLEGVIGASLGALISKKKLKGRLAGAALVATYKASEEAKKANVPVCVIENNNLIKVYPDGTKEFLRKIEKPTVKFPKTFELK